MRLLDTKTGTFVDSHPGPGGLEYAILSHTWDTVNGEQTYKQLREIQKRYDIEGHAELLVSVIPSSASQPSSIPPASTTTLVIPTEGTPLLGLADQPSLMEQGILSGTHRKDSLLNILQRLIVRLSIRMWRLLLILFAFVLHRRSEEPIHSSHHADLSSTLSGPTSPQVDTLVSSDPPVAELASSDALEQSSDCRQLGRIWDDPELSPKIREACAVARADGYRYIWIDSCCIDKSSSSELSEAINSMYVWYAMAQVCFAYLSDVPAGDDHWKSNSHFCSSRWFTRGWTLQELIAPINVVFLSQTWTIIGPKYVFAELVEGITGISEEALLHVEPLDKFSVAQRFSWAARRETTRVEDGAYSLLGIFDINMPTLYGEGSRAFRRLQEEIMQRVPEQSQSLFTWGKVYIGPPIRPNQYLHCLREALLPSPLATASSFFARCKDLRATEDSRGFVDDFQLEYLSSPYGIRTQFQMIPLSTVFPSASLQYPPELQREKENCQWYVAVLRCEHAARPGHLLGRVYWISSTSSGVDILYPGSVSTSPKTMYSIFPLSQQTIQRCRPLVELKTVYIPHEPSPLYLLGITLNPVCLPHRLILFLMLLSKTRRSLLAKGYTVDLQGPDESHLIPTTHCLTLHCSIPEYAIVVTVEQIQVAGLAGLAGTRIRTPIPRLEVPAGRAGPVGYFRLLSSRPKDASAWSRPPTAWSLSFRWEFVCRGGSKSNVGDLVGLHLHLDLRHMGSRFYVLDVDVVHDAPPSASSPSPVGPLVGQAGGLPSTNIAELAPSDANKEVGGLRGLRTVGFTGDVRDGMGHNTVGRTCFPEEAGDVREARNASRVVEDVQDGAGGGEGDNTMST